MLLWLDGQYIVNGHMRPTQALAVQTTLQLPSWRWAPSGCWGFDSYLNINEGMSLADMQIEALHQSLEPAWPLQQALHKSNVATLTANLQQHIEDQASLAGNQ